MTKITNSEGVEILLTSKPILTISVAARFSRLDFNKIKLICKEENTSPSRLIRELVREKLNEKFYV